MEGAVWQRSEPPVTGSDQTEAGRPSVRERKDMYRAGELCNRAIRGSS